MSFQLSQVSWKKDYFQVKDVRRLALFSVRTIVRDPHHRESPTRREQDLNLRRP